MDFAGRLKTSGAVVQQGSDNVAVAITHSERRYEYTASELDLYDMGEMRTVQLGDSNVHLQITQTSTMPDSTEGTQGVQESDGGVARSQHMASCPQHQVTTEPYQHRVEPCMHFKVHTKTEVLQFGAKCIAVNVRIFKENFDYLLKHGTLRVTEPDSNKELLRLSWKNNVKRFKTSWMLKFQKSLQKLETDILRGIRDQSVILKDYSNVESFIKDILNTFGAQFTNMRFCCFLLEFQHDSMDSVASMLKTMDSLKSCVVELLESALPQGQRLPAESLGFDLTSCVVDGYDVNVQELKEKFSSGIEKPQGQRSETQSKTGSLGSFDTDASIGEMSRSKYQTEPTSLEEPSSVPQREDSSRRSDERSGSKQTSERMDHINRWLDEKFKTHEDMTKKNEDQLAGIKSKVDQLLVMMQQFGTPLDPNQGLQFSGATSEKLKDMFTPSVQNHPGSLQSADRQKADTKLAILTELRGTPGLPTTHAVVNRVVVDYSSPPTSQMPPPSGNQAGTPAGASASTTGATMTPSASSSTPSSVAAGGRLGAGQGMPAQSSLHANPPFGKQTGLHGAEGGHSNLQTGQGSTVVIQAGLMGEAAGAAVALPPLKPYDDREFTVSDGKERRGEHASLPMEEQQETIRKHGQDISWKRSKMDSGVDIDASTSFKMKLDPKDMPENHGLSDGASENLHGSKDADVETQQAIKAAEQENQEEARRYLKKIHVGVSDVLLQSVQLALSETEYPPPPRSKGMDTVLCVDCSESVAAVFNSVRKAVLDFVSGIEEEAELHNIEENLAVVAVGGKTGGPGEPGVPPGGSPAIGGVGARVVQHLTNDYGRIRDAIESLEPGGRSPLFEALVVCAASISGKGGTLTVQRCHEIRPRAVVFTDGWGTDEAIQYGPDSQVNDSNLRVRLIRLVNEFLDEKHTSTPTPISWVTVGKAEKKLMQSLADIGKGKLVTSDEVSKLCNYYRLQSYVGQVYKCLETMNDKKMEQLSHITQALVSDISSEDKEYVETAVRVKFETGGGTRKKQEADAFDHVIDRDKEGLGLLPLGTRVSRGKDWKWSDQDSKGPGTVINHRTEDLWMWVLWDSGQKNQYRYGADGFYDLQENEEIPRTPDKDETIAIGMKVERVSHWEHGDEDGGAGSIGTVIRWRDDGMIKVRWSKTGHIGSYKFGKDGKSEVKIIDPAELLRRKPQPPSNTHDSPTAKGGAAAEMEGHPVWEWQREDQEWVPYAETHQEKLEKEFRDGRRMCIIKKDGQDFRVLLMGMKERTVEGDCTKTIRRQVYSDEEYELKKAFMMSLQQT